MRRQVGFIQVPFMGWAAIIAGAAILVLSLAVTVQTRRLTSEKAAFNQFKGGVAALGMEAAKDAANKDTWNKLNKEKADGENRNRAAALKRDVDRVRADADRAREGFVSQLTAAARRADKAEEFGTKFERAYRELVQEVRGVGDEGTAAVIDLDSAKDWAAKIK